MPRLGEQEVIVSLLPDTEPLANSRSGRVAEVNHLAAMATLVDVSGEQIGSLSSLLGLETPGIEYLAGIRITISISDQSWSPTTISCAANPLTP